MVEAERVNERIHHGLSFLSSATGIILGANFSPVGYFSMFLSQKDFAFCIFLSRVSPNFDGVKKIHPKNREIIM